MTVLLVGGGRDVDVLAGHLAVLLAACRSELPRVACVLLDEGEGAAGLDRYLRALDLAGAGRAVPVLVPLGGRLDVADLGDADALLVCGGLTPAYAEALVPVAGRLRAWLADGDRPYAGFSAGAAIAAERAVVGGWRLGGVEVCPQDASEDLDEVRVVDGLGLVPFAVEVHCAQWGTLPRLVGSLRPGGTGIGLDEGTALLVDDAGAYVRGTGQAWVAVAGAAGVTVTRVREERLHLP